MFDVLFLVLQSQNQAERQIGSEWIEGTEYAPRVSAFFISPRTAAPLHRWGYLQTGLLDADKYYQFHSLLRSIHAG
jgi:hypothetical protein